MPMATVTPLFFGLVFFFIVSGGMMGLVAAQAAGQQTWCVPMPSSSDKELQANIDYACSNTKCDKIAPGGPCSDPQTLINKASVAMNLYYQKNGRNLWNCDFRNTGLISVKDPSYGNLLFCFAGYGNCKYD